MNLQHFVIPLDTEQVEHARRETLLNVTRTAISWLTDYPTALSDTQVHALARIAHHATANHENSEEWHMLRELLRLAVREEQDREASYECPNCGGDVRDHYHRQIDVDWFETVYYGREVTL